MDTREFFNNLASSWSKYSTEEQIKKAKTLLDILDIKEGTRVLDLACGTGVISNTLYNYSKRNVLVYGASLNSRQKKEILCLTKETQSK